MSVVERYEPHSKGSVTFNNFGWLVRYNDYKKLQLENKALKENRDYLLEELKIARARIDYREYPGATDQSLLAIKKAEALKKKETK